MGHSVYDHITDAFDYSWVNVTIPPTEEPFFGERDSQDGFEFNSGVDAIEVERQIRGFHTVQLVVWAEAGIDPDIATTADDLSYVVLRDGRWHPDVHQGYLMHEGQPHLTAREWLDRKVQLRKAWVARYGR